MLALTVAFLTAALALLGNIVFGLWRQYSERRGVAGAIAGEIGAYLKLVEPKTTAQNFRLLGTLPLDARAQRLRALAKTPQGHPIFDKVADKIGLLPPTEAEDISAIYNVVTGLRITVSNFSTTDFIAAPVEMQNAMFNRVAEALEKYEAPGQDLIERLRAIANESFWAYLPISFTQRGTR